MRHAPIACTVSLVIAVSACGTGALAEHDAQPGRNCQELYDEFRTAAEALDDSCVVDADCAVVGGKIEDDTCDCAVELPEVAINDSVFGGSEAAAIGQEYADRCNNEHGLAVCDAAPSRVRCSETGQCVLVAQSCWDADAGVAP